MNQELIERWQTEFETADVKIVRQMLAEAPELVNVKVNHTSPNGRIRQWGPLFSASINIKSLGKVKALVEAGADVNAQALSGLDDEPIMDNEHFVQYGKETPLHFAARLGNLRMVRMLLDHGADPSLKTVSRISEPKEFAEWTDKVTSLVWPLREIKRVLFQPYEGETPLDMALREDNAEIANILKR